MEKIYVIRQGGKYYSDILEDRHYVYGFFNKMYARKFTHFLDAYKKRYSRYPYMEQKSKVLKPKYTSEESIFVDVESIDSFRHECLINSAGLFGVTEFDYVLEDMGETLHISGVDLTSEYSVPMYDVVDHLEFLRLDYEA